ncbi:MAG: serpin family protein [Nocardioidaceae bacterium]
MTARLHPLARRDLLRLLVATAAAGGLAPLLAACGSDPAVSGSGDLDLVVSGARREDGDPAAVGAVVAAMSAFAGDLYGRLAAGDGNLALSPYSVTAALGMTLNGAGGRTAQQMSEVLGLGDRLDLAAFNAGLNALTASAESLAGPVRRADGSAATVDLAAANQLFGDRSLAWAKPFLDVLATQYGAGMRVVDFAEDTEAARGLVNAWTAEQTHDRIPQIIPPGVLDALTRLVLVNALYLKAPWETPFEKGSTRPGDFHRLDGSVVRTDLMQGAVGGSLLVADGWQALRIPYAGGALAMTVVLPDRGRLPAVETLLREQGVAGFLADGAAGEVQLTLPSWTFRSDTPLGDVLVALGMTDAFDAEAADFDPMTEDPNGLFVSAVLHQTFIAVDEDGTEAAAATAVVMQDSAVLVSDRLVVDRPFLFVVHDTAHGTPYFLGRVLDPSAT